MKKSILGIICVILVISFSSFCINVSAANTNVNVENGWVYSNSISELDGSTTKLARVVSSNDTEIEDQCGIKLRPKLTIYIRGSKKCATKVIISIDDGCFSSNKFTGTNYVTVKFDKGKLIKFSTRDLPKDWRMFHEDERILKNPNRFIKLVKNAKTIKIEAPFYRWGWRVFTFNINKPLEWQVLK